VPKVEVKDCSEGAGSGGWDECGSPGRGRNGGVVADILCAWRCGDAEVWWLDKRIEVVYTTDAMSLVGRAAGLALGSALVLEIQGLSFLACF